MVRASICLATFNGEKFLDIQLQSILGQLSVEDELVIVDDGSSDHTLDILKSYQDQRIKLFQNSRNKGVNETFARAMSYAKGQYIFLSDQDDRWIEGRLDRMITALEPDQPGLVVSNYALINEKGDMIGDGLAERLKAEDSDRSLRNILKVLRGNMNYYGCAMGFTREFRDIALPLPRSTESHDLWFGIMGNALAKIVHLEQDTLEHRIHGNNASIISRPLHSKLLSRMSMVWQIIQAYKRRMSA